MKNNIVSLLCLFLFIACHSQIIITSPGDIHVGILNFNAEIIKQNKIKSIVLNIMDKPDGSVIIDKNATQGYDFDIDGRLMRYYYTILDKTQNQEIIVPAVKKHGRVIQQERSRTLTNYMNDTIAVNVIYDNQNRIIAKRVKTGDYYEAYYYEYNEQSKIKKEMHCKETNISEDKKEFKMGVQKILSSETFEYTVLTPTQIKKRCLNDEGREYKTAILNYNEKGRLVSENYEFIVTWMQQENQFLYNSENRLTEHVFVSNVSGEVKTKSVFEYDKDGILLSEKKYKNDELIFEINYLYDEKNTLIKSEVNRDHKNASIEIVKFVYGFY